MRNNEITVILPGNLFIQSKGMDFKYGELKGTTITKHGDGEIELVKSGTTYISGGTYTSKYFYTNPFQYLILSWNSDTPERTWIKIEGQVRVNDVWSNWRSWGTWSTAMERNSGGESEDSDVAYVSADTLTVKGSNGETANAFRYRVTLYTNDVAVTPAVRVVAGTIRNNIEGQAINKVYNDNISHEDFSSFNKIIDVPQYSQMIRDPKIANSICSATSIAMVLKYHGITRLIPEETAWGIYDGEYDGTGNWPFNAAYAGSYGFTSYVDYYTSMNDLKRELKLGNPVIASVRYRNNEDVEGSYPVIHGAPISKTNGHLITVVGFTKGNDGLDYAVVNDPAAKDDAGVRLKYLASEFDKAWEKVGRVVYVIHRAQDDGGSAEPVRLSATLKPTGNTVIRGEKTYKEFKLIYNDIVVDINMEPRYPDKKVGITIMMSKDGGAYEYIAPTPDKTLLFDEERESGRYDLLIFIKSGKNYTASINWNKKNKIII